MKMIFSDIIHENWEWIRSKLLNAGELFRCQEALGDSPSVLHMSHVIFNPGVEHVRKAIFPQKHERENSHTFQDGIGFIFVAPDEFQVVDGVDGPFVLFNEGQKVTYGHIVLC